MGEKMLKYVVDGVNNILNTDYNMISFDSLSKNALLQVCADCFTKLQAMPKMDIENNTDESLTKLLETVANIKVPTPGGVTSMEEFTEGIVQGKRNVVHPLLHWIASNQAEVKKRAYFARFLQKVSVPMSVYNDPDVFPIMDQYDNLTEEFKHVHSESTKYAKMGRETQEFRKDLEKLDNRIFQVRKQIERQKAKFENIPNKESLLVEVKAYRSEVQKEKTLDGQLQEQTSIVNKLDNQIKIATERLKHQKGLRLASGGPLGQLESEVQTISIIVRDRLPQEFDAIKNQLELVESISNGPPPTSTVIADLQAKVDQTALEVQKMLEHTFLKKDPRDDKMAQFRQHVTVVANNKQLAADAVIEVKEELNLLRQQVADKQAEMQRIVGGAMPQGEDLKRFVSKLRARSVAYKDQRNQLLELQAEVGVLKRTQEILIQQDPSLTDALYNRRSFTHPVPDSIVPDTASELIEACKDIVLIINADKADCSLLQQNVQHLKRECEDLSIKHQQAKEVYDASISNLNNEVEKLQEENARMEKLLQEEEEKWKTIRLELDNKEEVLKRIEGDDDDEIHEEDKKKYIKELQIMVQEEEEKREDMDAEITSLLADREDREQQVILWHATLALLRCKVECDSTNASSSK